MANVYRKPSHALRKIRDIERPVLGFILRHSSGIPWLRAFAKSGRHRTPLTLSNLNHVYDVITNDIRREAARSSNA